MYLALNPGLIENIIKNGAAYNYHRYGNRDHSIVKSGDAVEQKEKLY